MLKINRSYIDQINQANTAEDLYSSLQSAIMLEHSTIPPYLTAMFSLKPGSNLYIREILHSIVIEEMMHMTIAANILNALGGAPDINSKNFIPNYPGPLPMGIGNHLIVGLTKYSKEQVTNVFMQIEEPEDPIVLPELKSFELAQGEQYATIGQFYIALKKKILELPFNEMPGDRTKQVTSSFFSPDKLFPILSKEDAGRAIDIIVEEGEGTALSPAINHDELAHYYKFEELSKGRKIVADDSSPFGYAFSNEKIPFDENEVFNIFPDTKAYMLSDGEEGKRLINQFNFSYATLLNGLHTTFNGDPGFLPHTIGVMYDLKLTAENLCAMDFPGKPGFKIGPSFEYVDINK